MSVSSKHPVCSFCGKKEKEVERLIAGPGVFICNECIQLCNSLLGIKGDVLAPEELPVEEVGLLAPHEIKELLDEYVIGHCLLYTSPSPRDGLLSRMPSSA